MSEQQDKSYEEIKDREMIKKRHEIENVLFIKKLNNSKRHSKINSTKAINSQQKSNLKKALLIKLYKL